jgi:hypothetical protein
VVSSADFHQQAQLNAGFELLFRYLLVLKSQLDWEQLEEMAAGLAGAESVMAEVAVVA